jgi:predicted nucleic-acid-binding protein
MPRLAVDTNVLARALVDDGSAQSSAAFAKLRSETIFIPVTVLLETEWLLRSRMGLTADEINALIGGLLAMENIVFADRIAVESATMAHGRGLDFADALHLFQASSCVAMLSFDRQFAKRAGRIVGTIPIMNPGSDGKSK